jgi:UDP-N-acetylmuramate dehydrogenase
VSVTTITDLAFDRLASTLGAERVRRDAPLAPLTTFRVGGPADCLVEVRNARELASALDCAAALGIAVTVLGGGSNVLVSDAGVRGVVIHASGGETVREGESGVRADAGVRLNGLIRWTISRGLAGLEAFAGTPGSVGGAVSGNAHYGGRSIDEHLRAVRLRGADRRVVDVPAAEMAFAYGSSRVQRSGEIVLSALFELSSGGDPSRLRETARRSLAHRQRTQPLGLPSAGCVFRNPDPAVDRVPEGIPPSAGALIDRAGLKGLAIGGARVSPAHANFIVNEGGASALDVRRLIDACRDGVRARFGVTLRPEIRLLGW